MGAICPRVVICAACGTRSVIQGHSLPAARRQAQARARFPAVQQAVTQARSPAGWQAVTHARVHSAGSAAARIVGVI